MKRNISWVLVVFLTIALAGFIGACKKPGTAAGEAGPSEEQLAAEEAAADDEAAAAAAAKPAPPKVTDEVYIDLTVQSVIIRERNKEDPAATELEVEALFEKAKVTMAEYKDFERKLPLAKSNDLQKKIQEKLQPFIK